jgi:methylmalonyl-CoA/ethylmalonyl-CoA epimerase
MRVLQIGQHADDLVRAQQWYERFLGQKAAASFDPPGLLFFVVGDVRLLLDRGAPTALHYFEVDDVRTRIEELRAHGVRVTSEPHVIFSHEDDLLGPAGTDEWQAFVEDSEANLVGLVSQLRP